MPHPHGYLSAQHYNWHLARLHTLGTFLSGTTLALYSRIPLRSSFPSSIIRYATIVYQAGKEEQESEHLEPKEKQEQVVAPALRLM